jgi:hypothetical protein
MICPPSPNVLRNASSPSHEQKTSHCPHRMRCSIFDIPPFEVHEVAGKIICNAFATERKEKVTKAVTVN